MRKFTARTRLRGFTTYYQAEWMIFEDGQGRVKFIEGPLTGKYTLDEVVIALDEEWKLEGKQND